MNGFEFLRPHALWLFAPFLGFLYWNIRNRGFSSIWSNVCSHDLLPYLLITKGKRQWFPYLLILLTGSLLIMALAGPSWQMVAQPLLKTQTGLVIALDLSSTMDVQDIKPSRLQRAIFKITDLLAKRREGQTALVVFSEDAYVVTPLTDDTSAIHALLPALDTKIMPSSGHRADKAIAKAAEMLKQANIFNGSVLLITAEISNQEMQNSLEVARKESLILSVLGVGTEEGAPILMPNGGFVKDERGAMVISKLAKDNLEQLANAAKGTYVSLNLHNSDLEALERTFTPSIKETAEEGMRTSERRHDQGYLLVLAALPFACLFFRRGMLAFAVLLMPHALHAISWDNLWKTSDQQAQDFYHQGEFHKAENLFENNAWKAAANYRLGQYEEASVLFRNVDSADGFYNYGTAKAKQGDLEAALQAYEKTLEIDPAHEDALYNKKLIEEFKKQQKKEQNKQGEGQSDNQQNQPDQKSSQGENSKEEKANDQEKAPNADSTEKKQSQENQKEGSQNDANEHQKENGDAGKENQEQQVSGQEDSHNDGKMNQKEEAKNEDLHQEFREEMNRSLQEKEEKPKPAALQEEAISEDNIQKQNDERYLQRIKDDPGGLLRRKFLLQYRQQNGRQ